MKEQKEIDSEKIVAVSVSAIILLCIFGFFLHKINYMNFETIILALFASVVIPYRFFTELDKENERPL